MFSTGDKVALINTVGHHDMIRARQVDKVHKNGNFTLVGGDGQQWRPDHGGDRAFPTGNDYPREHVVPWTAEVDQRIAARAHQKEVNQLVSSIEKKLAGKRNGYGDHHLSDAQLAALRAFLATME